MSKSYVMVKSYPNGLKVILDNNCSFNELKETLANKMVESRAFFNGASVVITFEGRSLNASEEKELVSIMETEGNLLIAYIIGTDAETSESIAKAVDHNFLNIPENGQFGKLYIGDVKNGYKLQTESGVVILGNVESEGTVRAGGSVIVMGNLEGTIVCESDTDKMFIASMNYSPTKVRINDTKFPLPKKKKLFSSKRAQSKIAYIKDKQPILEDINSDAIKKLVEIY